MKRMGAARIRKLEEAIFRALMLASLAIVFAGLAGIVFVIILRGASSLHLSMILKSPEGSYYLGGGGGVANAIVGSLCLAFGATLLSFFLSLPIAFALQREYLGPRLARLTTLSLDILWGIPSIVYGAFGFIVMLYFGLSASMLGGIIALTFLMLPIMTRSIDEVIRIIPRDLKEASYALAATRTETSSLVVWRQALPGIVTAILLAFGRGIGDTASILFTAGYTDSIPRSLFDPVASLPLAIFFQISTPIPEVQQRAYASALILLAIVVLISMGTRLLGRRYSRHILR